MLPYIRFRKQRKWRLVRFLPLSPNVYPASIRRPQSEEPSYGSFAVDAVTAANFKLSHHYEHGPSRQTCLSANAFSADYRFKLCYCITYGSFFFLCCQLEMTLSALLGYKVKWDNMPSEQHLRSGRHLINVGLLYSLPSSSLHMYSKHCENPGLVSWQRPF